jgi:hypothetical protein
VHIADHLANAAVSSQSGAFHQPGSSKLAGAAEIYS